MFFKFYMNAVVLIDLLNSNDSGSSDELAIDAWKCPLMKRTRKSCKEAQFFFFISFSSVSVETRNDGINYFTLIIASFSTLLHCSLCVLHLHSVSAIFCHYPFCQTFLMVGKSFLFFILIYTFVDQRNDWQFCCLS